VPAPLPLILGGGFKRKGKGATQALVTTVCTRTMCSVSRGFENMQKLHWVVRRLAHTRFSLRPWYNQTAYVTLCTYRTPGSVHALSTLETTAPPYFGGGTF